MMFDLNNVVGDWVLQQVRHLQYRAICIK